MLKFILIGCGAVSEILYKPAFHYLDKKGIGKLVAVVDINIQRAKEFAADFGANAYDNLDNALKYEKLDAAVVATPHAFHAPVTIQCLEAGLGVLCEKPMAISSKECESMVAAAEKVKKPLAIGFFRRNFPSTRAIKLLIEKEALGPVTSFEFLEGEKYSWPAKTTSFFSKEIAGGGVLIDAGAHLLDLLFWWLGDVKYVDYLDDSMGGIEANCELKITMIDGTPGRVRMSREYPLKNEYILHCEKGDLVYRCDTVESIFIQDRKSGITHELNLQKIPNFGDIEFPFLSDTSMFSFMECFFEQLEKFCAALNDPEKYSYDLDRAMKGVQLIEKCYNNKKFFGMPWLSDEENTRALELSGISTNIGIYSENSSKSILKIGVIGAGGFVGYRVCEWMILNNRAKITPIIHTAKNFALLGRFDLKAEFADLLDPDSLEQAFRGHDIIIHAAVGDEKTIVKGIENTLHAAKKAGIKRIVYISTICVYGNAPADGTDETSPLLDNQKFSYNRSKVKAEEVIFKLRKELALDVVILRPLLIWGPRSQYWIIDLGKQIESGTAFLIDNGKGICNCTYIDNLIEAIWLVISSEDAYNEDFNIFDSDIISWHDYYQNLASVVGIAPNWKIITKEDLKERLSKNKKIKGKLQIKRILTRIGSKTLPKSIKRKITKRNPNILKPSELLIDEEISSLQLSEYKLKSDKARSLLEYKAKVTFNDGIRLTKQWMHFIREYCN